MAEEVVLMKGIGNSCRTETLGDDRHGGSSGRK